MAYARHHPTPRARRLPVPAVMTQPVDVARGDSQVPMQRSALLRIQPAISQKLSFVGPDLPLLPYQAACLSLGQRAISASLLDTIAQLCLIDRPRDIREQGPPIHASVPRRLFCPPLASSMRDAVDSRQAAEWVMAGS
jgi:hypothetical protein